MTAADPLAGAREGDRGCTELKRQALRAVTATARRQQRVHAHHARRQLTVGIKDATTPSSRSPARHHELDAFSLLMATTLAHVAADVAPGFRILPLSISQLRLSAVLKCGQSFRWHAYPLPSSSEVTPSHEYRFCLRDRVVCLRQSTDTLYYRSEFATGFHKSASERDAKETETLLWIRDYFQLDVDLSTLYNQWSTRDPVFLGLRENFGGIRVLRQDPFECLLS